MFLIGIAFVTVIVLVLLLSALLLLNKYDKSESIDSVKRAMNATMYSFFMFMFITAYILVIIIWEEINALESALLLATIVWGANKFSCWCIEESYVDLPERKLNVVIAVIEISLMFWGLAKVEQNPRFYDYIFIDLAIIIGFFVSLDALVGKTSICELIHTVWEEFGIKKVHKVAVIVPTIFLSIILICAFTWPKMFSDSMQKEIDYGMLLGVVIFLVSMSVILINKKTNAIFQKIFFKSK